MEVTKKVVSNVIYLFLNTFVLTSLSFIYWLIAGKFLLPSEYGKVTTSYQLMFLLGSLSNVGFALTLSKLVPEFLARNEDKKIPTLIKTGLKISLPLSLLFIIFLLIFSSFLLSILKVDFSTLLFICLGIIFLQLSSFFTQVWYGFQNMRKIVKINAINQTVKVIFSTLLLWLGWSYKGPVFAMMLSFLVSFLLFFDKRFLMDGEKIPTKKIIFTFVFPAFIANLAWFLFNNTQYIILTILKNTEITGIFSVVSLICSQLGLIPGILAAALFPLMSALSAQHQQFKQSLLISKALKFSLILSLPLLTFLIVYRNFLILLISRSEYLEGDVYFFLLAPAFFIFSLGNFFLSNLYAIGKSKIYRNVSLLISFLYLSISVLLTYIYSALGLAISYLTISSIFFFIVLSIFSKKIRLKIEKLKQIFFLWILFSFLIFLIDSFPSTFFFKFFLVLLNFFFYFFLIFKLVFDELDKSLIEILLKRLFGEKSLKLFKLLFNL